MYNNINTYKGHNKALGKKNQTKHLWPQHVFEKKKLNKAHMNTFLFFSIGTQTVEMTTKNQAYWYFRAKDNFCLINCSQKQN